MRVHLIIVGVSLALSSQVPAAETAKVGHLIIHDAWVRAPLDVNNNSAAYMSLEVGGHQADRLLAAETTAAERAELRTYWMEGCFAHRPNVEAIEVFPDTKTVLDPGGLHIELIGVEEELVEGRTIPLTLTFEKAGRVEIEVSVRERRQRFGHGQGQDVQAGTN
jgi:copper(I)-binding protein